MDLHYLRLIGLGVAAGTDLEPLESTSSAVAAAKTVAPVGASQPSVSTTVPESQLGSCRVLEPEHVARIPAADVQLLRFLLVFLQAEGLGTAPLFINGGYVRDLLLGKEPDDLDLSLCLRGFPEETTVSGLLERIPAFAEANAELGIVEVKIATVLSDESKEKHLDTFKAHFRNDAGQRIEVDIMPTIGEEAYDEGSRVPVRDQRGTPRQDALRRDLTIGALLLRVQLSCAGADVLSWTLLDFFGGEEDLHRKVLRAPCPQDKMVGDIKALLHVTCAREEEQVRVASYSSPLQEHMLQVLWWAKILVDDPLRICRALRFATKLKGFALHDTFWEAVPFAIHALQFKVAGARKYTEYLKIGTYGFSACVNFSHMAFTRTLGSGGERLATALFGGQDAKNRAKTLSPIIGFDVDAFSTMSSALQEVKEAAELFGGLLAAAVSAARFSNNRGAAAEFAEACDGMCVSNAMREAGTWPMLASERLRLENKPAYTNLECGAAAACGMDDAGFSLHLQIWSSLQAPGWSLHRQQLALRMLGLQDAAQAERVKGCMEVLQRPRPPVKGSVLATKGVLEVPPSLRRQVLMIMEVSLRILELDVAIESANDLCQVFDRCPGLRDALSSSVWYEADGKTLRFEFQPPKRGKDNKKQ
eukprot:CAMPEP_0172727862 /NCGR_PEP_ID=MMETSP1074-20121228/91909_1 /TAXON_ID=2916 /ORGANISM="Ceratium fusus, Strain PA161109" /LENGTH=645 /DNA_ID=CAMNT_0013555043 /DNA_START=18 /DNA_END=1955 /DNA_ORIENTATION=-